MCYLSHGGVNMCGEHEDFQREGFYKENRIEDQEWKFYWVKWIVEKSEVKERANTDESLGSSSL